LAERLALKSLFFIEPLTESLPERKMFDSSGRFRGELLTSKGRNNVLLTLKWEMSDKRGSEMKRLTTVFVIFGLLFLASCSPQSGQSRIWGVDQLEYEDFQEYDAALARGINCIKNVPVSTLTYYPAKKGNGTAVVVCPGGGYGAVCYGKEGLPVAKWLNSLGIDAFVLRYRLPGEGNIYPAPLKDAQRAIRLVRSNASKYDLDPNKIGIMGFSAGGHLASTAGTKFDFGNPSADSKVDRASCRPDFMILVYPVITLEEPYAHMGSRNNLLGDDRDNPEMVKYLSSNLQVTKDTPPSFLAHAADDVKVPVQNSILFNQASIRKGVPSTLKIYNTGGHGFSTGRPGTDSMNWTKDCEGWLRKMQLL